MLDGSELDDARASTCSPSSTPTRRRIRPPANYDYANDPRLPWLVALIERLAGEKFLLICRTQSKVLALEEALRTQDRRQGRALPRRHDASCSATATRRGSPNPTARACCCAPRSARKAATSSSRIT